VIYAWLAFRVVAISVAAFALLFVVPIGVIDPLAVARLLPVGVRDGVVQSPARWSRWSSVTLGVFTGGAVSALWFAHNVMDSAVHRLIATTVLALLVGVPVFLAVRRVVRNGAEQWALYGTRITRRKARSLCRQHTSRPAPGRFVAPAPVSRGVPDGRPAAQAADRRLRGWGRSLTAATLCWLGLGRVLQAANRGAVDQTWWVIVAIAMPLALAAVWSARGWRRSVARRHAFARNGTLTVREVMQSMGMNVQLPAGKWVRAMAPIAFAAKDSRAGLAPWPWAGIARTENGRSVLLARHHGRTPGATSATEVARTACCVRVPGARLPTVMVTGREGVPVRELRQAIALELESFNRSLWAYGPDARGVYALMHPRAMSEIMATLPDGATAAFAGDYVAVYSDEPVLPQSLSTYVAATLALAELIPTYLLTAR
jgi:hypothetical protein